ncbi:MAG: hypothetical protein ACRCTA_06820, partial [Bacilli bacterium]
DEFEKAYRDGKKLMKMGSMIGFFFGIVAITITFLIKDVYNVSDQALTMTIQMVSIASVVGGFNYLNASVFFILRAGGDTRSVLIMDAFYMWLVIIPCILLLNSFNLYMPIVYLSVQILEIAKFAIASYRFRRRKWLNNLTIKQNYAGVEV